MEVKLCALECFTHSTSNNMSTILTVIPKVRKTATIPAPSILGETQSPHLYKCCIPILHITLGIVHYLFNKIEEQLSAQEMKCVGDVLEQIEASRASYHGKAFEGRAIKSILKNLDDFPWCFKRTVYYTDLSRFKSLA